MLKNFLHFALAFLISSLPCSSANFETLDNLRNEEGKNSAAMMESESGKSPLERAVAKHGVPPGPPTRLYQYLWGHYPEMRAKGVLRFISEVTNQYGKDGAPVRVSLGMKTLFIISDPEDAHLIVSGPDRDNFVKGFSSQFLSSYFVGEGIGFLETKGEGWKELHDAMLRLFFSETIVKGKYFDLMQEHSQNLVRHLENQDGRVVDLEREMTHFTMKIISRSMLNVDLDDKTASELADSFATVLKFINYRMTNYPFYLPLFFPTKGNSNFKNAKGVIDSFIQKAVEKDKGTRNDNESRKALISYLREASELDPSRLEPGRLQISPSRFLGQLKNVFMAGHDTTKHLLTSIFYQLAQNPAVKKKLEDELKQVILLKDKGLHDVAQLSKHNLPYLDAVIQEAMRTNASVPAIARDVVKDVNLGGYTIPRGSVVMISFDALHKNSKQWENPLEFNPERFLTNPDTCATESKRHRNSLMPFSAGQRMCLGKFFALQEVKIAVIELILSGIDFELLPESNWTPIMACTMRLQNGLIVRVKKRDPLAL